jgi:hypothetical protein
MASHCVQSAIADGCFLPTDYNPTPFLFEHPTSTQEAKEALPTDRSFSIGQLRIWEEKAEGVSSWTFHHDGFPRQVRQRRGSTPSTAGGARE